MDTKTVTSSKYNFSYNLFGKYNSTPLRDTQREAWADIYSIIKDVDARYVTMTLVRTDSVRSVQQ